MKKVLALHAGMERVLVLFGLNERREPRAARFEGRDEAVVVRMAKNFGLRVAVAIDPHEIFLARKLVQGKSNTIGRNDIPEISWALYRRLNDEIAGGDVGVICASRPKHWDHIGPSHLVIAESTPGGPWWPAFVLRRHATWLVLQWRDRPEKNWFSRKISEVALLASERMPVRHKGRFM